MPKESLVTTWQRVCRRWCCCESKSKSDFCYAGIVIRRLLVWCRRGVVLRQSVPGDKQRRASGSWTSIVWEPSVIPEYGTLSWTPLNKEAHPCPSSLGLCSSVDAYEACARRNGRNLSQNITRLHRRNGSNNVYAIIVNKQQYQQQGSRSDQRARLAGQTPEISCDNHSPAWRSQPEQDCQLSEHARDSAILSQRFQ